VGTGVGDAIGSLALWAGHMPSPPGGWGWVSSSPVDCWTLWPPFGGSRFGKGSSHRRRWGAVRRKRCVSVHRRQPGDGPNFSFIMNPGRFNHEPSDLVFCRSHGPDRRTAWARTGKPVPASWTSPA